MKISGAEIIIESLKQEGVKHIFGSPGGVVNVGPGFGPVAGSALVRPLDVDAIAPQVAAKFMSAFVRAVKPAPAG